MKQKPYIRTVQYYETDKMGIVHHSNYIRWFEESRIDLMDQMDAPYKELEESGILIPVLSVGCQYKAMVHFGERVAVFPRLVEYTGVRMRLTYTVAREGDGALCTTGESSHCFITADGRPVSLKKANPRYHERFLAALETSRTAE
ncbi:MAG: acyl-CoA thioesterase [Candidatus Howiella sp.]|jgi:acyl-CoA thioester hydrolase